jgi:hypothetical protein
VLVRFCDTPHNAPTRRLFEAEHWVQDAIGYRLPRFAALPVEPTHCHVVVDDAPR